MKRGYGGNCDTIAIHKWCWRGGLALGHGRVSHLLRCFEIRERLERRGWLMFQRPAGEMWGPLAGTSTLLDGPYGRVWLMYVFPMFHFSLTRLFSEI